jgi:hypothetical protein
MSYFAPVPFQPVSLDQFHWKPFISVKPFHKNHNHENSENGWQSVRKKKFKNRGNFAGDRKSYLLFQYHPIQAPLQGERFIETVPLVTVIFSCRINS